MILKLIAFIAAAAPILMFLRTVVFPRRSETGKRLKTFKRQLDFGVNLFLAAVACVMAWALVEAIWAWF